MNEGIELHDSRLVALTCTGGEAILALSPAYIHRTAGRPGVDPGSGWSQAATLTFGGASLVSEPVLLPTMISDGFLRLDAEQHDNVIPAGGIFAGAVELFLVLSTGEALSIKGERICIRLHGERSFVENFDS